jgi:anti-anti-sigma factor
MGIPRFLPLIRPRLTPLLNFKAVRDTVLGDVLLNRRRRIAMSAGVLDFDLDVERGPDWLLVRVRRLDLSQPDCPPLAERVWCLMEQHFIHRLVLELDQVPLFNSRLIGQLIQLYRRIVERDGVMRLCGLSPRNLAVLHQCRLDERLPAYEDRQEAILGSAYSRKPR